MTTRHHGHVLLAAAALLTVAACSGGDDAETSATSAPASPTTVAGTPSTQVADAGGLAAGTATTVPATTPAATAAPATSSTTTPPPTTEPPPPSPTATLSAASLIDRRPLPVDRVNEVAVVRAEPDVAIIVGSHGPDAGVARHASVWTTSDGETIEREPLNDAGAPESTAYGVGVSESDVAVAGAITTAAASNAVIWRSVDGGASFGIPEVLFSEPGLAADVDRASDGLVVAGWRGADPDYELVVSRETADGWVTTALPVTGISARINGLVADGARVVITGTSEIAGRRTGRVWWSDDAGATFTEVNDTAIDAVRSVGAPINGGDGVIATAQPEPGDATRLVTSADGVGWRTIELSLERDGEDAITPINGGSSPMIRWRSRYAVGFTRQLAAVAAVDDDGRGEWEFAPYDVRARYTQPRPMLIDDELYVVGETATSFRVAHRRGTGWTIVGTPPGGGGVPADNSVELFATTDGTVARDGRWPEVRPSGGGGITWSPGESWRLLTPDGSEATRTPSDTRLIVTHGGVDVAFGNLSPDPDDDELAGPSAGTWVTTRNGGGWNTRDSLLTGPGGEYIQAAVSTPAGLVAVGTQYLRDERGVDSSSVLIREHADDVVEPGLAGWSVATVDADLGTLAELYDVVLGGDGTVVATGSIFESGRYGPLVVARTDDGWVRAQLPSQADDVDLWAEASTPDGVELFTQEDRAWFVYRSSGGVEWERSPIVFDDPGRSFPEFVVGVEGRTILVGFRDSMLVRTLAAWVLADDGTTTPIAIDDAPFGRSFGLTSVLPSDDGLLLGGTLHQKNTVWTISFADLPS